MKLLLLGIQHSPQDHLRHQVILEEVILAAQIRVHTIQELLVRPTAVLLTIDPLDQVMALHVRPLMVEASPMVTILEAHRAGQAPTLQTTVLRADPVLEQAIVLQVEVRVDPQAAQAQEDPEEGGINSPFFLDNLSENTHNFVTNPN